MICPKCGFEQEDNHDECLRCGLVFSKFEAMQKRKDMINSRYSPGSTSDETEESEQEPEIEATLVTQPEAAESPAITPAMLDELRRGFDKVQVGIHSSLTFQEGIARDLSLQKSRIQDLFEHFTRLSDTLDQQVLELQAQLEPLAATTQALSSSISQHTQISDLRSNLESLEGKIDHVLSAAPDQELTQRLKQLESAQKELRSLLKGIDRPDAAQADPEVSLLKTEVQALRSEVRNLMDQAIKDIPATDGSVPAIGEERIKNMELRLEDAMEHFQARIGYLDETLAPLPKRMQATETQSREVEERITTVMKQMQSLDKFSQEIDQLKSALNLETEQLRDEMQQRKQVLDTCQEEISRQEKNMAQIQEIITKLGSIFR